MFFLLLAIISSSSLALILKHGNVKKSNITLLINANYLTASLVALIFIFLNEGFHFSIYATLFAIVLGFLLAETFVLYSKGISIAGTALATVSARLSVLIPVLLSIFFIGEKPKMLMLIGFALALLTLYFFYLSLKKDGTVSKSNTKYFYLILLLLGIGIIDFSLKLFERNFPIIEKGTFVFLMFFFAFIYTLSKLAIKNIKFEKETYKLGLLLGIPNVFSIHFILAALSQLPAIVVFPIQNIGVIVFTAVSAYLLWKERINKYGMIALIMGVIAIVFLKI
jgi:drug/metabolite transporter (DMT)-like permease